MVTEADIKQAINDSIEAGKYLQGLSTAIEEIEDQLKQMNFGRAMDLFKSLRHSPILILSNRIENIRNRLS